jgi:hypothetical protein
MSIVLIGSTSGSITLQEPAVAGNTILELPATSGTLMTTGAINASSITTGTLPKAQAPLGSIIKTSHFTNVTRVALSDSAGPSNIWTVSITKDFNSSTSDLVVFGNLQGRGNYSDQCGVYAHISGSTSRSTDGSAFYDVDYYPANGTNRGGGIVLLGKRFESLGVGSHTLEIGWQTRNGSSGDKPYQVFNPDSNDDARSQVHRSNLVVYEILR